MENQTNYEITVAPETVEQSEALTKIINDAHIELTEGEQIKQSYLPYFNQLASIKKDATKINYENPSPIDSEIARSLRIATVKIRTGSEKVKDERKRIHMLKSNLEQSSWNLIRDTCKLDEEKYEQVEKFAENQEKLRIAAIMAERTEKLLPYFSQPNDTSFATIPNVHPNLGVLTDDQFENLLQGYKLAHEGRIAAQKKAEEEARVKAEKEKLLQERLLLIAPYKQLLIDKSSYSGEIGLECTKEAFDELIAEGIKLKQFNDAEQERIRIENEKLKEQQAVIEKQLAEERAKAEAEIAIRKEQEEIAARKAAEQLRLEKEKAEALQAELDAKRNAEIKAKKEAEKAAKKAASAPDRDKIVRFTFQILQLIETAPVVNGPYVKLMEDVKSLLFKVNGFIDTKLKEQE